MTDLYLVRKTLHVCQQIGCAKQATWTLFDGKDTLGEYCHDHGSARLKDKTDD